LQAADHVAALNPLASGHHRHDRLVRGPKAARVLN
jgi:hypothetical protein